MRFVFGVSTYETDVVVNGIDCSFKANTGGERGDMM